MSEKFYIGLDVMSASNNGKYNPVSRVTLMLDASSSLTAGDDTGHEITAYCPYATQEMVDDLLSRFKGYEYQAFEALEANIDPAAELGDGATVGGVYGGIYRMTDDGMGYPSISAPGEAELEDEYPAVGPMTQEFNRELAKAYSMISRTTEEIMLEVNGKVGEDEVNTLVKAALGEITLAVSNSSTSSTIKLMLGSTVIASDKIQMNGLVTFEGLEDGTTIIDGSCIQTGTISAKRLNLTGAITFDDLDDELYEHLQDNQLPDYIKSTRITSTDIYSPTIHGGEFYGNEFNVISESSDGSFNLYNDDMLHVLSISHHGTYDPYVVFDSPCSANVTWAFNLTSMGGNISMGENDISFYHKNQLMSLRDLADRITALENA